MRAEPSSCCNESIVLIAPLPPEDAQHANCTARDAARALTDEMGAAAVVIELVDLWTTNELQHVAGSHAEFPVVEEDA